MAPAHEVLGVRPGAGQRELRVAFRRFARAHHPDRGGDPRRFQAGLDAYRQLTGRSPASHGDPEVVFHRRRRGLGALTGGWPHRRRRPQRSARLQ